VNLRGVARRCQRAIEERKRVFRRARTSGPNSSREDSLLLEVINYGPEMATTKFWRRFQEGTRPWLVTWNLTGKYSGHWIAAKFNKERCTLKLDRWVSKEVMPWI